MEGRFRFSLRRLIALMTVLALLLGAIARVRFSGFLDQFQYGP
jgi:hypothetical protein